MTQPKKKAASKVAKKTTKKASKKKTSKKKTPPKKKTYNTRMGRPTKYVAAIYDEDGSDITALERADGKDSSSNQLLKFVRDCNMSIGEAATAMQLDPGTVHAWSEKYDDFSLTYKACRDISLQTLMHRGLTGEYNASFTRWAIEQNWPEMRDWHKKASLELKEKELDAKINGDISEAQPIEIKFVEKAERDAS